MATELVWAFANLSYSAGAYSILSQDGGLAAVATNGPGDLTVTLVRPLGLAQAEIEATPIGLNPGAPVSVVVSMPDTTHIRIQTLVGSALAPVALKLRASQMIAPSIGTTSPGPSPVVVPAWGAQPVWFIDPVAGSDTADGATPATPIKTWTELRRRILASGGVQSASTIAVMSALPNSDPMLIDWAAEFDTTVIQVVGGTTLVRAGTATAAPTARVPATNTPNSFKDGATVWAADMRDTGRYLVWTDGPAIGCEGWVWKDAGAGVADTTSWIDPSGTEAQPLNGNAYEVRQLCAVGRAELQPTRGQWLFSYFRWPVIGQPFGLGQAAAAFLTFNTCEAQQFIATRCRAFLENCSLTRRATLTSSEVSVDGGAIGIAAGAASLFQVGSRITMTQGALVLAHELRVLHDSTAVVLDGGFFDSANVGLKVDTGATAEVTDAWGSGNANAGIEVTADGTLALIPGDLSKVTSVGDEVVLAGVGYTWAAIAIALDYIASATSAAVITPAG